MLLESEGFEVIGEALDGATVLREADRLRPDIVVLDVHLPDTDGFAVAEWLTEGSDGPAVILVSSRDEADYGPLITRCGARGFLAKSDLSGARIRPLLADRHGRPPAGRQRHDRPGPREVE